MIDHPGSFYLKNCATLAITNVLKSVSVSTSPIKTTDSSAFNPFLNLREIEQRTLYPLTQKYGD
jgi:hypothetical protein